MLRAEKTSFKKKQKHNHKLLTSAIGFGEFPGMQRAGSALGTEAALHVTMGGQMIAYTVLWVPGFCYSMRNPQTLF